MPVRILFAMSNFPNRSNESPANQQKKKRRKKKHLIILADKTIDGQTVRIHRYIACVCVCVSPSSQNDLVLCLSNEYSTCNLLQYSKTSEHRL